MSHQSSKKKLSLIRDLMRERGIDAYIIPNNDPHLGENIPEHWKVISWLTGFTGSNATVIITRSFAGLWTDSRYFLQAEEQLRGTGFELFRINRAPDKTVKEWLAIHMKKGGLAAFDGRLVSIEEFRKYRETLLSKEVYFDIEADLVSQIWENRPPMPVSVVFDHPVEFSGESRISKIERLRDEMTKRDLDFHLLTSPDDIMWLLNIRANDLKYSPLLISFAIITGEQILLFADQSGFPPRLAAEFDKLGIVLLPYEEVYGVLETVPGGSRILISPAQTSAAIFHSFADKLKVTEGMSIPSKMKSVKNNIEIGNIRNVMVRDGVALTKFFFQLGKMISATAVTEREACEILHDLRLQQVNCTGDSFSPIIAFNEHAAMPHYSPRENPETLIGNNGILLVDSGGQYLDGTTDITRCIATGTPTPEQKRDFTLALKGTISVADVKFPLGTRGYQIDILGRKALWDNHLDYGHGTGHGVGFYLNVHESPPGISPGSTGSNSLPLVTGMIVSDEPAVYRDGKYGFRTENLLLVTDDITNDYGTFLKFETLSLCYIDLTLIERSLLNSSELAWLNNYHKLVYQKLSPFLSEEEKSWLMSKTREF
jgi:Xaa-Pro aminopeptidase